jgi:DNA modification methylase
VHCVVTSPPYWGLRDYGTATWEGGDPACDHATEHWSSPEWSATTLSVTQESNRARELRGQTHCSCGARRVDAQLGLEATPREYIDHIVAVFAELHRVLRPDGTLWLNLGDSYGTVGGDTHSDFNVRYHGCGGEDSKQNAALDGIRERKRDAQLRPKNLVGIPWRVAFALQDWGWNLRQDIIWQKPNVMPESVTDRCTKAHEYIFLLTKSERYHFDAAGIAEPSVSAGGSADTVARIDRARSKHKSNPTDLHNGMRPRDRRAGQGRFEYSGKDDAAGSKTNRAFSVVNDTRNCRSVWTIPPAQYKDAHFAVFPEEIPRRCILAGCPEGGVALDPFGGAGTTGLVADRLKRSAILIELNPEYAQMAARRIEEDVSGRDIRWTCFRGN